MDAEQMRHAALTWVATRDPRRSGRRRQCHQAARRIAYHPRRNRQARASHTKTTRRKPRKPGIRVDRLRTCVPDDP